MDSGLPRYAPKSAIADLGTKMPISSKPEIGGPGMTTACSAQVVRKYSRGSTTDSGTGPSCDCVSHLYSEPPSADAGRKPAITRASREDAMNRRCVALAITLLMLALSCGGAQAQT